MRCRLLFVIQVIFLLAACAQPAYRSRVIEAPGTEALKGWEKPYEVNGERYQPMRGNGQGHVGFVEEGIASWYGPDFHGKKTSNGETYDMYAMTSAHKTLPLGVFVRVTNRANGRQAVVRVNDRGPFVKGRIIDLSFAAAKELGVIGPGTAPVRIEALGYRETVADGSAVYRQPASYTVGSYSVQVGAFSVRENAQRLAGRLQEEHGFASVQQGWVNGSLFHRVRVGKYDSLEAAEAAKEDFEKRGYRSCFVVAVE